LVECIKDLEHYVWNVHRSKVGRARLMRMKPKSCLTYHRDDSSVRLHIPIVTNEGCFFINNDIVGKMHKPGVVYLFDVASKHTAVNASREDRIHLVINCYR
jgi:Aspartyl/Asparaginyl beta-hydroxylase